jgi:hypothetical protein
MPKRNLLSAKAGGRVSGRESIRVNSRLKFLDSVRKWAYLGNQNNFASFRKNWMNIEAALKNLDNQ